jgi:hypothetical protein
MMKIMQANMWDQGADVYVVTTNSYINARGELAMGRGAALEAKKRFPGVARIAGTHISHMSQYGFLMLYAQSLGLFQVKRHFKEKAELDLIIHSTNMMKIYAERFSGKIVMNFPGIGYGGLNREDVLPLLTCLPDNVVICER